MTFKALLAYYIPASQALTAYLGDTPESTTPDDETFTWPLVDYATKPSYKWLAEELGPSESIGLKFSDPIKAYDATTYLALKSSGGLLLQGKSCKSSDSTSWDDLYLDDVTIAGSFDPATEKLKPGWYICRQFGIGDDPHTIKELYLQREITGDTSYRVTVSELGLFEDCSLPYNPELSTYFITPVLPEGGSQDYTSMGGRRSSVVYSPVQYDISMTFTWSDPEATARLRTALQKSLEQGSPLLFAEPSETTDRPVHLLYLTSTPTIQQVDRNTWTTTIQGITQP